MKGRIVAPFITDADDLFAFDNIEQMKQEISGIAGINYNQIIRLNRFEGSDLARIHYRRIADKDDGSGVAITINTSNDKTAPKIVQAYAVLAVGFPFYKPAEEVGGKGQLVYWDGTQYVILGEAATQRAIMTESESLTLADNDSGFSTNSINMKSKEVSYFQFLTNGEVDTKMEPELFTVEPAGIITITEDYTYDTDKSFKIEVTGNVESTQVVEISFEAYTLNVTVEKGEI